MDFKISKSEFLKGLRFAQSIADRKSTMPMIANVLLKTIGKDQLLVIATDLNVSLTAELRSQNLTEGSLTIAAKDLFELVSNAPGDEIAFRKAENHWAEIKAGKVNYKIVGMPDRDFPRVPDNREVPFLAVESSVLRDMIDKTLFSVSSDETYFHLSGVLFECDGKLAKMISIDGHRLSKVERPLAGPTLSAGVIIPKKGLVEMKKLLEAAPSCRFAVKTPYVYVQAEDIALAVKLIDAQFPPYEQVIPKGHTKQVVVDRVRLIDALRRAQFMSSDNRGVKFAIAPSTLTIASTNPARGEVKEDLDADYSGAEMQVGFNPKYLIELLNQISADQVTLFLGGELDPGLVQPLNTSDYLGVVMPMRI